MPRNGLLVPDAVLSRLLPSECEPFEALASDFWDSLDEGNVSGLCTGDAGGGMRDMMYVTRGECTPELKKEEVGIKYGGARTKATDPSTCRDVNSSSEDMTSRCTGCKGTPSRGHQDKRMTNDTSLTKMGPE